MTNTKTPLIIIPGLGDRAKLHRLVTPLWRLLGYEPYIFSFGWEDVTEDFTTALKRLTDYIDNLQTARLNIIGISAGGTAAVNALADRPQTIRRIVTVATPYSYRPHLKNQKLRDSIDHLNLDAHGLKEKILSMHGLHDQTVPVHTSKPTGIRTRQVCMSGHVSIIVVCLTVYSVAIRRFLKGDNTAK